LINVGAIYEALIFNEKREGKLARMIIMQHINYYIYSVLCFAERATPNFLKYERDRSAGGIFALYLLFQLPFDKKSVLSRPDFSARDLAAAIDARTYFEKRNFEQQ